MPFFRTRARIRREAADWVVRLAKGGGAGDREAFMRWHGADPRHAEAYDRLAGIWRAAGRLPADAAAGREVSVAGHGQDRFGRIALAAALAAAIIAALALLVRPAWLSGTSGAEQSLAFASAPGEIRQERLPDGSSVTLDSASRIEARFGAGAREVVLVEGRARFRVAREARPFIVRAGASEVVATGTVFDVALAGGRLSVVLIEGSVEVRGAGGRTGPARRLRAGDKLMMAPGAPASVRPLSRGDMSWPGGMLEFDDTPLAEAAALVNRYGGPELRLADREIGRLRVSGAYRAGDVEGFARSAAAAFGLTLVRQGGAILLARGPALPR